MQGSRVLHYWHHSVETHDSENAHLALHHHGGNEFTRKLPAVCVRNQVAFTDELTGDGKIPTSLSRLREIIG